jgi:hypothetical protein
MRIKEAGIERTNEILPNGEARAAGEVLQSNGNGTMSWQVISSSGAIMKVVQELARGKTGALTM